MSARVVVLGTGGTIAGAANGLSAGGYASGRVPVEALVGPVPLPPGVEVVCHRVSALPGQDVGAAVWRDLAHAIEAARADGAAGVVVVHGTDTLEETAFALHLACDPAIPVVVTGAVRPAHAPGADGPANLTDAIRGAAGAPGLGVAVCFDGLLLDPAHLHRARLTSTREFETSGPGPYGIVTADGPILWRARAAGLPRLAIPETLPQVEILFGHADVDARIVTDAVARGAVGVVWAGTGNGNAPGPVIDALAEAVRMSCAVVRASRIAGGGMVLPDIEVNDAEHGFVTSLALDAPKARVLLQLALAAGFADASSLRGFFADASGLGASAPGIPAPGTSNTSHTTSGKDDARC